MATVSLASTTSASRSTSLGRAGVALFGELPLDAGAEVSDVCGEATGSHYAPITVGALRLTIDHNQVQQQLRLGQIPLPIAAEGLQ